MKIPVRIAFATDLKEGLSSLRRTVDSCLANVEDNHFRTSSGTASDCSSERSSDASSLFTLEIISSLSYNKKLLQKPFLYDVNCMIIQFSIVLM